MGRGVRGARARAGAVARPRARLLIGRRARAEFTADLRYIRRESQKGAETVLRAVNAALQRLRVHPGSGRVDPDMLAVPPGASARRLSTTGYIIRYLHPIRGPRGGRAVLILSIRHGARLPIGDDEFLRRYAEEEARLRRERA